MDQSYIFEYYRDAADEWRWRVKHTNGNILAVSSEGYKNKQDMFDVVTNMVKGLQGVVFFHDGELFQEIKMTHQDTPYVYVLVRKDLSLQQQVVQSSHAVLEATRHFINTQIEHPHLIVLGIKDESRLLKSAQKLEDAGIRFKFFVEPDIGNEFTALATEPVFGDSRRIFRNFQLLKINETLEVPS